MTSTNLRWRKSTFSGPQQNCVEVAEAGDAVLVRNSNRPELDHARFTRGEIAAFVAGAKAGEFDDLA